MATNPNNDELMSSVNPKTGELLVTDVFEYWNTRYEVDATLSPSGEWFLDRVIDLGDGEPNPPLSKSAGRHIRNELSRRLKAGDYNG